MKPSLFVISLLSGFVFPAFAQQIDDAYLASLIKDVKQAVSMQSATAIAVVQGDKIIFEHYDGYIDIEGERPAGPDSLFYIASVTKPFTALNALLDEHNNRISLNTKLVEMLPNSTLTSRHNVTVQQLLTHTGSIDNPSLVLATAYSGVHTPETLRKIAGQLSTESEEAVGDFRYTNVGYNLYSIYSNARFDSSWQDKLAAEVFGPAGMSHTSAAFSAIENKASIAKPYTLWPNGRETALAFQKSDKTMHAAGGVYTTATDLGRFLIAQLNHGLLEQKQVYPAQVIAKSHQKQAVTDSSYLDFKRSGYAYGWYVGSYKEQQLLFHFGGFAGAHAHLSFMPEHNIGIVVLNNEDFVSARMTSIIADYLYSELLQNTSIKPRISKRLADLKGKLAGLEPNLTQQSQKLHARKWLLSLGKAEYLGEYQHPLLGSIWGSESQSGHFELRFGMMKSDSLGMNEPDKIRVELMPNSGEVISFSITDKVEGLIYNSLLYEKVQ